MCDPTYSQAMVISQLYLACLVLAISTRSQVIPILDTRADYVGYKEGDVAQLNFATLIADEKEDLPDQFTVCSTIFTLIIEIYFIVELCHNLAKTKTLILPYLQLL